MVRRLVGFYEYGNALADLDRLVSLASKEDLTAIDEIIADNKEFDVYMTLPDSFSPEDGYAEIATKTAKSSAATGTEFRRSGLAWITALARVEFGAMIAGFTEQPFAFSTVTPETHDYENVMQLLLEGVTEHYKDVAGMLSGVDGMKRDASMTNMLTLSRRIRIARTMLVPLLAPGESEYSSGQAQELANYKSNLDVGQTLVNGSIRSLLGSRTSSSSDTISRETVNACGLQLRAEDRELAAGTATVERYSR